MPSHILQHAGHILSAIGSAGAADVTGAASIDGATGVAGLAYYRWKGLSRRNETAWQIPKCSGHPEVSGSQCARNDFKILQLMKATGVPRFHGTFLSQYPSAKTIAFTISVSLLVGMSFQRHHTSH